MAESNGKTRAAGILGSGFVLLLAPTLVLAGRSLLAAILIAAIVVVTSAILVTFTIRNYRRLNRQLHFAEGFCSNCGYDLRESGERCPECGTPADQNET